MQTRSAIWIGLFLILVAGCSLPRFSLLPASGPLKEITLEGKGDQKVMVISINGVISDQPRTRLLQTNPSVVEEVVAQLQRAERDSDIKALLIKVNSPGGTITASDILYHEISGYKERTGAVIVVCMMNLATSGGYYISLPADWIMAHPTTVTGSLGVIFMRPQISGFMQQHGFAMEVNTSGEQKDMGSPFRPSTDTETAIFQALTDGLAGRFLDLVATHRKLAPEQLARVASARVYLAPDAHALGLVDQIGYLNDALAKTRALAGLDENARVVTYRRRSSEDDNIYNPSTSAQRDALGAVLPLLAPLTASMETGFYYLWPAVLNP